MFDRCPLPVAGQAILMKPYPPLAEKPRAGGFIDPLDSRNEEVPTTGWTSLRLECHFFWGVLSWSAQKFSAGLKWNSRETLGHGRENKSIIQPIQPQNEGHWIIFYEHPESFSDHVSMPQMFQDVQRMFFWAQCSRSPSKVGPMSMVLAQQLFTCPVACCPNWSMPALGGGAAMAPPMHCKDLASRSPRTKHVDLKCK